MSVLPHLKFFYCSRIWCDASYIHSHSWGMTIHKCLLLLVRLATISMIICRFMRVVFQRLSLEGKWTIFILGYYDIGLVKSYAVCDAKTLNFCDFVSFSHFTPHFSSQCSHLGLFVKAHKSQKVFFKKTTPSKIDKFTSPRFLNRLNFNESDRWITVLVTCVQGLI